MSTAKFSVIAARRVLSNAAKNRVRNITTEIPRCEKLTDFEGKLENRRTPIKSRKRKQIFGNCEKLSHEQIYCEKLFPGPQPKIASIDYQRAYQTLKLKGENLQKYIENESRSILEQMENELRNSNVDYCLGLVRSSTDMGLKLRELTHLDESCGSLKCKEMLTVNDQTRRAFRRLQCDAIPSIEKIQTMLERIREEVASSIVHAVDFLLSCRDCDSPQALTSCVEKQTANAEKFFAEAKTKIAQKLETVKGLRDKIIRQHKTSMDEVIVVYRAKIIGLSRQLQKSIDSIKHVDE